MLGVENAATLENPRYVMNELADISAMLRRTVRVLTLSEQVFGLNKMFFVSAILSVQIAGSQETAIDIVDIVIQNTKYICYDFSPSLSTASSCYRLFESSLNLSNGRFE